MRIGERIHVEEGAGIITVRIKVRNSTLLWFLPFFVALLLPGIFVELFSGGMASIMATVVGLPLILVVTGTWLWIAFGSEVMSIHDASLMYRRELFRYVLTEKILPFNELTNLRVSVPSGLISMFHNPANQLGFGYGSIAVDQRWDTHRFGEFLKEDEATALVSELRTYLPGSLS